MNASYAEEFPSPATGAPAFEQALRNVEAKRKEERKILAEKFSTQLKHAVNEWISQAKAQKDSQMNQIVDQNWDKMGFNPPLPPGHYDFYLRGYTYDKVKSDIIDTDSLTSPYKAQVVITEKLYVERYHSPDISNVDPYFFTVTNRIDLSMEYHQDNFVVTNTEYKIISIENKVPDYLKKMRL